MGLSAQEQALLDALEEEDASAAPAASVAPPIQATRPANPAPAVEPQERQQVRAQEPEPAYEPPIRRPVMHGKPGGLRDTLFKNGPMPQDEAPTQMSPVSAPEYYAQKAGNFALGMAKAPISMVEGMGRQYGNVVLDAAAASPFAEYPKPEEIARPGRAMPQAPTYSPAMDAAGSALRSGAEFGAMFTPLAPVVGGAGVLSGLKQSAEAPDTIAAGEGMGHAGLASMLTRHSLARGMSKVNQAGVESTAADMPVGLRTPENGLAMRAAGAAGRVMRAPLESLDAALRVPGDTARWAYDKAAGNLARQPPPPVEAAGFPEDQPGFGQSVLDVQERVGEQRAQELDAQIRATEEAALRQDVARAEAEAAAQRQSQEFEATPAPQEQPTAPSVKRPFPQLPPAPIPVPEVKMGKRARVRAVQEQQAAAAAKRQKELQREYPGTENLERRIPAAIQNRVPDGFVEGASSPLPPPRRLPLRPTPPASPYYAPEAVKARLAETMGMGRAPEPAPAPQAEVQMPRRASGDLAEIERQVAERVANSTRSAAPAPDAVNSSAPKRRLPRAKKGAQPELFQEPPAKPGGPQMKGSAPSSLPAMDRPMAMRGMRAYREWAKTGKLPPEVEQLQSNQSFNRGWKIEEQKGRSKE